MSGYISPDEKELRKQVDEAHDQLVYMLQVYCTAHPDSIMRFTVEEQRRDRHGRTLFDQVIDMNGAHKP